MQTISERPKNLKHPGTSCCSWEKKIFACILKPRQLFKKIKQVSSVDRRQQIGVGRERENSCLIICPIPPKRRLVCQECKIRQHRPFCPQGLLTVSRKAISIAKDLFNRHPGKTLHICLQSLQRSCGQMRSSEPPPSTPELCPGRAQRRNTQPLRDATGLSPVYRRSNAWGVRTRASYTGTLLFKFLDQTDGVTLGKLVNQLFELWFPSW